LAAAKSKGRVGGGKRKMTSSKVKSIRELLNFGLLPNEGVENLGVAIATR